jgi:hypothetical protein
LIALIINVHTLGRMYAADLPFEVETPDGAHPRRMRLPRPDID